MRSDTGITYNWGAQTRKGNGECDYYGVIRSAVSSGDVKYAYIIEHGFHSNPTECAWLMNENNLKRLAAVEAAVIAGYFGLKNVAPEVPEQAADITPGCVVRITGNTYYSGKAIPS